MSLNWKACDALRAHLRNNPIPPTSSVFLSRTGGGLTARAIQRIVKKYMVHAGITGASVHTLRHTFATHMVRKGTHLRVIQEALGHTSLQTTSVYVSLARDLIDQQLPGERVVSPRRITIRCLTWRSGWRAAVGQNLTAGCGGA